MRRIPTVENGGILISALTMPHTAGTIRDLPERNAPDLGLYARRAALNGLFDLAEVLS